MASGASQKDLGVGGRLGNVDRKTAKRVAKSVLDLLSAMMEGDYFAFDEIVEHLREEPQTFLDILDVLPLFKNVKLAVSVMHLIYNFVNLSFKAEGSSGRHAPTPSVLSKATFDKIFEKCSEFIRSRVTQNLSLQCSLVTKYNNSQEV